MIALVGKTATGKTEICKELIKLGMNKIITTTTRPMREGEVEGSDYYFVSDDKFEQMKNNNEFIETTEYNTVHGLWKYGTPFSSLKDNGVIILNPDGLKAFKDSNIHCFIFYIKSPMSIIRRRLIQRGDSPEESKRRIEADNKDFIDIENYSDYTIFNDNSESIENIAHKILEVTKNYEDIIKNIKEDS